jgi:hypothetical protein
MAGEVEFRCEALPPPAELECEWRALETTARPSFFTSWHWIGTLLAAVPVAHRPGLLRGVARGSTVALALLGAGVTRRRHGMIRSRGVYLNETGDPCFDALTIEHNGILAAAGREAAAVDAALAWSPASARRWMSFISAAPPCALRRRRSKVAGSVGSRLSCRRTPSISVCCHRAAVNSIRCSAPMRGNSSEGRFGSSSVPARCG